MEQCWWGYGMARWASDGGYHTSRSSPILPLLRSTTGSACLSHLLPPLGPFWDAEVFHGPAPPGQPWKEVNGKRTKA